MGKLPDELHDQPAELHDPNAKLPDELHDRPAALHDPNSKPHDRPAELHDPNAKLPDVLCDRPAELHERAAKLPDELHDRPAELHDRVPKLPDDPHDRTAKLPDERDQPAELHDRQVELPAVPHDRPAEEMTFIRSRAALIDSIRRRFQLLAEEATRLRKLAEDNEGREHHEVESFFWSVQQVSCIECKLYVVRRLNDCLAILVQGIAVGDFYCRSCTASNARVNTCRPPPC